MNAAIRALLVTGLIQASNLVSGILLARILMPDGRGELAAIMLWPSVLAGIGILGIHEATTYFAARNRNRPAVLNASLGLGFGLVLILLPVGWLMVELVFAGSRPEVRDAALLYLLFIPLNYVGLVLVGLFQGAQRFGDWNLLRAEVHVLYTLFVPLAYGLGYGTVWGFAVASLVANLLMIATGAALLARQGWLRPEPLAMSREILGYGWRIHLGRIATTLGERLDQMLISLFLAAADLGFYVVAYTVANAAGLGPSTLAALAFSRLSEEDEADRRRRLFGRFLRAALVLAFLGSLLLALVAAPLIRLVFGEAFQQAVPVALILIAGMAPFAVKLTLIAGLKAYGQPLEVSRIETVGVMLAAVGLAILLPAFGLIGAALAVVAGQTGTALYALFRVRRVAEKSVFGLLLPNGDDLAYIRASVGRAGRKG